MDKRINFARSSLRTAVKPERMVNISRVGEAPIPSIQASSPWGAITLLVLLGCVILAIMLLAVSAHAQMPDSPGEVKAKSHIFTKKFVIAYAAYGAADVFDTEMTQRGLHRPCGFVEGGFGGADRHPSRKEMYLTDGAIYAALFGFGTLMQWAGDGDHSKAHKYIGSWIPYMAPVYGTVLHLKGGISWYQKCG